MAGHCGHRQLERKLEMGRVGDAVCVALSELPVHLYVGRAGSNSIQAHSCMHMRRISESV